MKLQSLNDIFERRVLRIPDYQRGYAWQSHQLEDFWEDLVQLSPDKVHYTGVLTLEPVSDSIWGRWDKDCWLIDGLDYRPYYVVDGQQRLTTSIILIQAILETLSDQTLLNHQSTNDIRAKFIHLKAKDDIRQSFIFGYEKDNPSDEFLKTEIFKVYSDSNLHQKTLYTNNLIIAKEFFLRELRKLTVDEVSILYKKLTQKFKFNVYEINDELDVFVTFETMNNRGKPLSNLELLKNRLIYLSTLFENNEGRNALRVKINNVWKTIYEYLGKNPSLKLDDDEFLKNHWIMYFKYSRRKGDDYIVFLLDEYFTARNVTHPKSEDERVSIKNIEDYVTNLQQSIRPWFFMHSPYFEQMREYNDEKNKLLLNRLDRLRFGAFKPLIMASYVSNELLVDVNKLLEAAERLIFSLFIVNQRRANTGDSELYGFARQILVKDISIDEVVQSINKLVDQYYDPEDYISLIKEKFKVGRDGFYHWEGLRYFLYEYEYYLKQKGKHSIEKLDWDKLINQGKNNVTVEHICPQTATGSYWQERFKKYDDQEMIYLTHSLGNLVPLSRAKNSSLQNDSFPLKKNNGAGVGYYNGSVSENEIAQKDSWEASNILSRGLDLLRFMEIRWGISLGDEEFKKRLLHLQFLDEKPSEIVKS